LIVREGRSLAAASGGGYKVQIRRYVPPHAVALVSAGLQEQELALDWLERAYEADDLHLAFLTVDPDLSKSRSWTGAP
jgi:hypothetical protein